MYEQSEQLQAYEKRFGNIAVEMNFITPQQLFDAFKIHISEETKNDFHRLIGEILFDLDYITEKQVQKILFELRL